MLAHTAGPAAWAYLTDPAPDAGSGQVLAVYKRSLLLLAGPDEPLTLAWDPALRGPFTLEVEGPVTHVAPGDRAVRTGSRLTLGPSAAVDLSRARLHDPPLPTLTAGQARALRLAVQAAWGDETLRSRAEGLVDGLKARSPERVSAAVARLVGLGPGLTPSGDDFLAGMLAALQATGSTLTALLSSAVARHREQTTLISRHFLRWALQRRYGEPIRRVFASAGAAADVEALLRTGATSGADTAAGIRAGLSLTENEGRRQ